MVKAQNNSTPVNSIQTDIALTDHTLTYKVQTRRLFHCAVKIKLPASCPDRIFDDCFNIMADISQKYNAHDATSYFYALNQHSGNAVTLDETSIHLLNILKAVAEASQGAYDFTIMPLLRLWGFYPDSPHSPSHDQSQKQPYDSPHDSVHNTVHNTVLDSAANSASSSSLKPPTPTQIKQILPLVDYRKVQINGLQATLAPDQEMATGSFIKSFAVDQVMFYLKQQGISDALVNAGGSTISCLNNEAHPYWTIAFAAGEGESAQDFQVKLSNQSFSLSTVFHNFILLDQVKYGHILSPETGQPSPHAISAVISDLAFYSDVFSTALFAQQQSKMPSTLQSLNQLFPFDYFILDAERDIQMSHRFREAMLTDA